MTACLYPYCACAEGPDVRGCAAHDESNTALAELGALIRCAPAAHAQSNLLIRRAAVASSRRFTPEPEHLTGFGGLEHKAYLMETGEWQADGEQELRDRDCSTPWGDPE